MLIRFSVENFLSFNEEIEFSMIAGKQRLHPEHVVTLDKPANLRLLKAGVIYGANASGKTNLIKAIDFANKMIFFGVRPKQLIPINSFKFDKDSDKKPSKFEFELHHRSHTYIYGFTLTAQQIHEEWLYEITATTEKKIFERKTIEDKTSVEFGIKFDSSKEKDFLDFTAMGTRPNQLFLTETIERDIKHFEDVYDWFKNVLVIIFPDYQRLGLPLDLMVNKDFNHQFQTILTAFDTGIEEISVHEFDSELISSASNYVEMKLKDMGQDNITIGIDGKGYIFNSDQTKENKAIKLITTHKLKNTDDIISLEINEESDGTQRLLHIIPALIEMANLEKVFIIDELDRSLHPHVSHKILDLFLNQQSEHNSQLIVTTHESSLLDLDLLRRDEIWFIEKNTDGESTAYSLEEFAPRYDKDIRKGYLLGRFGAIPFVNESNALAWMK